MSLASTASKWTNDDTYTKKRQPSLNRKTIKKPVQPIQTGEPNSFEGSPKEGFEYNSIEDVEQMNETRNDRVNKILNTMSLVGENDGDKLADFNPPPKPTIQLKKDLQTGWVKPDEKLPALENPLQMPAPSFSNQQSINPYVVNTANYLGNYQQAYDSNSIGYKPYYAKMGLGNDASSTDSKLMEKLNYMIHLLENQEKEKTDNVTEEFILYTFLGVFVIFVLDSFTRNGKYVR